MGERKVFDCPASIRAEGDLPSWGDRIKVAWMALALGRLNMVIKADTLTIESAPEEPQP